MKEAAQMNSRRVSFRELSASRDSTSTHSSQQCYPFMFQITDKAAPALIWGSDYLIAHIAYASTCCWPSDWDKTVPVMTKPKHFSLETSNGVHQLTALINSC